MKTTKKMNIGLTLAAVLVASWALPAAATDYSASNYLPLAVGNSWTYEHDYNDPGIDESQWSAYTAQYPSDPQFTITVERTEVIDGKTYYVISNMPENWPPAPLLFLAGKKLRWEGTQLMERTSDGEQAIFRFPADPPYEVSTDEGNIRVQGRVWTSDPVPIYHFDYPVPSLVGGTGGSSFLAGFGMDICGEQIFSTDVPLFINGIYAIRAVLGGIQVEHSDALKAPIDTSSSSSSWGNVKESFLANALEGRTSR